MGSSLGQSLSAYWIPRVRRLEEDMRQVPNAAWGLSWEREFNRTEGKSLCDNQLPACESQWKTAHLDLRSSPSSAQPWEMDRGNTRTYTLAHTTPQQLCSASRCSKQVPFQQVAEHTHRRFQSHPAFSIYLFICCLSDGP